MTKNELLVARLDGVVRAHACRVKLEATGTGKDDPSYRLDIKVDFSGWTVQDVIDMAVRPLVISRQRVWKDMTPAQIELENGKTFLASDMGKKPSQVVDPEVAFKASFGSMSPEEQLAKIEELKALAGIKD